MGRHDGSWKSARSPAAAFGLRAGAVDHFGRTRELAHADLAPIRALSQFPDDSWANATADVSSFAIVRKFWLPSDHVQGSVAPSGSFLTCRSLRQAFWLAVLQTDLLAKNQKVSAREKQPTQLPTHRRIFGA